MSLCVTLFGVLVFADGVLNHVASWQMLVGAAAGVRFLGACFKPDEIKTIVFGCLNGITPC